MQTKAARRRYGLLVRAENGPRAYRARKSNRESIARRRRRGLMVALREFVARGGACQECGLRSHYGHYEWAHVRRDTKRANIAHLYNAAEDVLRAELAKCRLLCRLCHADETAREEGWAHCFFTGPVE